MVYGDDDNFVKLTDISIWETRQTEFAKELSPAPEGWSRYGNTVVGPPGDDWTWLRIVVERLTGAERRDAGGDTERYTAYTSQDGVTWVRGGAWTHRLARRADRPGVDGRHRPGDRTDHRRVRRRAGVLAPGRCPAPVALDNLQPFGCMFVG